MADASTVWKTELAATDLQTVVLPIGAEIIHAAAQREKICIWYRCNPNEGTETRKIAIVGTGHTAPLAAQAKYIGTAHLHNDDLIFHIFEQINF